MHTDIMLLSSALGVSSSQWDNLFVSGLVWFVILASPFVLIVMAGLSFAIMKRLLRGGRPRKEQRQEADDTRIIQEIHNGLQRMEDRIDALETIIMDRSGSRKPGLDRELR